VSDLARLLLTEEIEAFLYREAELLDERRYEEWLDLLRQKTDELAFLVRVREIGLRKTSDLRVDWSDAAIDGRDVKLYVGRKS